MKRIIGFSWVSLIAIALLTLIACGGGGGGDDSGGSAAQRIFRVGKSTVIAQESFFAKLFGAYAAGGYSYSEATFNEDGTISRIDNRDTDATLSSYYKYTYDSNGLRIKKESVDGPSDVTWLEETYEYNANDLVVKISSRNPVKGTDQGYLTIEYDANNNKTKLVSHNNDGSLVAYNVYEYDGDNRITKQTNTVNVGTPSEGYGYYTFTYSTEGGNIVQTKRHYNSSNVLQDTKINVFEPVEELTISVRTDADNNGTPESTDNYSYVRDDGAVNQNDWYNQLMTEWNLWY